MRVRSLIAVLAVAAAAMVTAATVATTTAVAGPDGARAAQALPSVSAGPTFTPIGLGNIAANHRFSSVAVGHVLGSASTTGVVAGFPDGTVRVFDLSGALQRTYSIGTQAVQASPTLIPAGDGADYVVGADLDGSVKVFDPSGRLVFSKKLTAGVFGTPTVANLDGHSDLIVTSYDMHIYAWQLFGGANVAGWPVYVKDTIWSSPTVAYLDGDGTPEVIFGFDCAGDPTQPCYPNYGGYLGVLKANGTWRSGFPILLPKQTVWSTPAVADLEGNGHSDIVVGTGNYTDSKHAWGGTEVYAYRSDGTRVPGWPATIGVNATSSPAIGDLNGDGKLEVAIVGVDGKLHVYDHNGHQLWAKCLSNPATSSCAASPYLASPSIADINGDGKEDIVVGGGNFLDFFDGAGNPLYNSVRATGSGDPLSNAPAIVSVNGKTAIFAEDTASGSGAVGHVYEWTTGSALGSASWPGFKGGPARTGRLGTTIWPATLTNLGSTLTSGGRLLGGDYLQSGNYRAVMQGDGDLVVYRGDTPTFTNRGTRSGSSTVLQGDGNLVTYSMEGVAQWSSRTDGSGATRLVMQGDGNLVLYNGGTAVWSTHTH